MSSFSYRSNTEEICSRRQCLASVGAVTATYASAFDTAKVTVQVLTKYKGLPQVQAKGRRRGKGKGRGREGRKGNWK